MKMRIIHCTILLSLTSAVALNCSGCGLVGGAVLGGIIGYQSGEALAGAAIGAAVCGAGEIAEAIGDAARKKEEQQCAKVQAGDQVVVHLTNQNGSYTPVVLTRRGCQYVGPQGEYYASVPTDEQLRPYYGLQKSDTN